MKLGELFGEEDTIEYVTKPTPVAAQVETENLPALSTDKARQDLAEYVDLVAEMSNRITSLQVTSDSADTACLEIGMTASKLEKKIKEREVVLFDKPEIKAVRDYTTFVHSTILAWTKQLKEIVETAKLKHKRWQGILEQKQREEDAAAQIAREKLQKELDARNERMKETAKAEGITLPERPAVQVPQAIAADIPRKKVTDVGTSSMVEHWAYELKEGAKITDVDSRYLMLMLNKSLVELDINKNGIREIPGLKIFRDDRVRFGK